MTHQTNLSDFALPRVAVQVDSQNVRLRWGAGRDDSLQFRLDEAAGYWEGE